MEIENSKSNAELKSISKRLRLVPSKDGTGINLAVRIRGHQDTTKNRYFYLLRVLHDGNVIAFKDNPSDIGFEVNKEGYVKIKIKK